MKKTLLTFGVLFAVICCTLAYASTGQGTSALFGSPIAKVASQEVNNPNVGVSIGTVEAQLYSESGLSFDYFDDVEYVSQTSEGTYMGFEVEKRGWVYDPETGEETYDESKDAYFRRNQFYRRIGYNPGQHQDW